jgi:hypothetical protein
VSSCSRVKLTEGSLRILSLLDLPRGRVPHLPLVRYGMIAARALWSCLQGRCSDSLI